MRATNLELRNAAKEAGVFLWQIGEAIGLTDDGFSRKLRHELPPDEMERLLAIIDELSKEQEAQR